MTEPHVVSGRLTMLGAQDAVCVDGVCEIPGSESENAQTDQGRPVAEEPAS